MEAIKTCKINHELLLFLICLRDNLMNVFTQNEYHKKNKLFHNRAYIPDFYIKEEKRFGEYWANCTFIEGRALTMFSSVMENPEDFYEELRVRRHTSNDIIWSVK